MVTIFQTADDAGRGIGLLKVIVDAHNGICAQDSPPGGLAIRDCKKRSLIPSTDPRTSDAQLDAFLKANGLKRKPTESASEVEAPAAVVANLPPGAVTISLGGNDDTQLKVSGSIFDLLALKDILGNRISCTFVQNPDSGYLLIKGWQNKGFAGKFENALGLLRRRLEIEEGPQSRSRNSAGQGRN